MTRALPTKPIELLLRHFTPSSPFPLPVLAQRGADALATVLPAAVIDDLNDGQYSALIDRVTAMGATDFAASRLPDLVADGNHTLAVEEFKHYGERGLAERAVWLAGNQP